MNAAKYVIINGSAIVFSPAITHKEMVGYGEKAESAGFVTFRAGTNSFGEPIVTVHCFGKSVSLGIESKPEEDSIRVTRQITDPPY